MLVSAFVAKRTRPSVPAKAHRETPLFCVESPASDHVERLPIHWESVLALGM